MEKVRRYYDRRSWRYKDCPVDPVYKAVWEDPYSLNCLQQLCGCLKDESLAGELKAILLQDPTACMELDERELLKGDLERAPFKILSEPNFLYAALREEADRGLDLLIRLQHPDGRWHLPYRFGEENASTGCRRPMKCTRRCCIWHSSTGLDGSKAGPAGCRNACRRDDNRGRVERRVF